LRSLTLLSVLPIPQPDCTLQDWPRRLSQGQGQEQDDVQFRTIDLCFLAAVNKHSEEFTCFREREASHISLSLSLHHMYRGTKFVRRLGRRKLCICTVASSQSCQEDQNNYNAGNILRRGIVGGISEMPSFPSLFRAQEKFIDLDPMRILWRGQPFQSKNDIYMRIHFMTSH
jgi:hypothetical protein